MVTELVCCRPEDLRHRRAQDDRWGLEEHPGRHILRL